MHSDPHSLTLSEYERLALTNRVNLSDGHARHRLSSRQRDILDRTLEFYDLSLTRQQNDIEAEFLARFFECAGQDIAESRLNALLTFSSSSAIKMAAQYCRIRGIEVLLIEPCFDNIVHLLTTEGITVHPILETQITDMALLDRLLSPSKALWIVQPNNPTGFCLDQRSFTSLINKVSACGSTLLLDFCFRLHSKELKHWDQYHSLVQSGVSFIAFEDTGKTWSLGDTKVGITVSSCDAKDILYRLHDELLLNVSPLHLLLLTEFIRDTLAYGFEETVGQAIELNRELVHAMVENGSVIHSATCCRNVPMELLSLPDSLPSAAFWEKLRRRGVDILPAHNYFWTRPEMGKSMFRIPLSRPRRELEIAVPIIEQTIADLRRL